MSRCFPFPPPGYERKLRFDDGNVLAKEKDKEEEKHTRYKNKEKKEGKEKDKDRSKDRHREKEKDKDKDKDKEKKEKHKHKNKDKKKDKNRSRDERGGSSNAEKVGSNSPQSNHFTGSSAKELGQRIGYVDVAPGNQTAGKINDRDQGRGELLDKPRFDQTANGQRDNGQTRLPKVAIVCNLNGVDQKRAEIGRPMEIDRPVEEKQNQMHQRIEKVVKNKEKDGKRFEGQGVQIDPPKDTAFVQELGRRIRAENGASRSQVIARPNPVNQKRMESTGKFANGGNAIANHSFQAKETSSFGNGINRKDGGGPKVPVVHNFKGLEQRGPEMVRPANMVKKVSIGGTEKNGFSGIAAMGRKEKKIKTNDEDRNKAKTEEKAKQGGDSNIIKLSRLGESGSDSTDYSKQHALPASKKSLQGVTAKRKEPETNGFLHDNEVRPSKLPRTVVSPQSNSESGRNLQQSATITLSASKQGTPNCLKLDSKELKVNGIIGAQQSPPVSAKASSNAAKANGPIVSQESPLGSSKPPSAPVGANGTISAHGSPLVSTNPMSSSKTKHKHKHKSKDKDRSSSKPPSPHPDTKYLSQILSIPKLDDWSESNDEEWLFNSNSSGSKDIKMGSLTDDDGQHQVWAKAVHIEPADVYALPYVIPY